MITKTSSENPFIRQISAVFTARKIIVKGPVINNASLSFVKCGHRVLVHSRFCTIIHPIQYYAVSIGPLPESGLICSDPTYAHPFRSSVWSSHPSGSAPEDSRGRRYRCLGRMGASIERGPTSILCYMQCKTKKMVFWECFFALGFELLNNHKGALGAIL